MRRMAVNDALNVGPGFHDLEVQQRLARPLPRAGELIAFHVDQANVFRLEKPLAAQIRRAKDFVLADAVGNVAIVGRREPALVEPVANLANLTLVLFDVRHL